MKWNKYSIKTTTDAVDMIGVILQEMGITGIEIEDNLPLTEAEKAQMFVDILPPSDPEDKNAVVSFYVEEEKDTGLISRELKKRIEDLRQFVDAGDGSITKVISDENDWRDNWKEFWKPFKVASDIWIKPTWETIPPEETEGCKVVEMDPGSAFGTGTHHTTRLCIDSIRAHMERGASFLDLGCGSGILFIIAKLLGAGDTAAVDIDPAAVKTAVENAEKNGLDLSKIRICHGNVLEDKELLKSFGKRDIVAANILAEVIIPLNTVVKECLHKDSLYIVSGIIDEKEEEVRKSLSDNGFEILETGRSGEWVSFCSRMM